MRNPILPVILAAGMGTRLLKYLGPDLPKGLAKIDGKSIVEFQLDVLDEFNIPNVLIVVGHLQEKYRDHFGSRYKDISISYIVNDAYATTGSAASLMRSQNYWRLNKQPILMLHADIFYDPKILRDALLDSRANFLVTDEDYIDATNDEQVVFGRNGLVTCLIKGPEQQADLVGESVAINVFSVAMLEEYFPFLEETVAQKQSINWEQTIEGFLSVCADTKIHYVGIEKRRWVNINYTEDIEYAIKKIHPSIPK